MLSREHTPAPLSPDRTVLLVFFLAIVVGGGNAVAIRFGVRELPPLWSAALRFGGAAILLWVIALLRRSPLPARRALPGLLLFGFLNFGVAWAFIYSGLRTVEAGMAQVLVALTPLLTFFFAILHRQESFRWRGLAGALVALAGIAWAFLEHPQGGAAYLPMLAIVAGAACLGEGIVLLKRIPPMDPFLLNAVGMTTGAVSLMILSRILGEAWSAPTQPLTWLSVIYLVVIGTLIFFSLITFVVRRWSASASAYALVLMPLETVTLSAWLTGEKLNSGLLLGGALVLLGVWIGAFYGGQQPRSHEAAVAVGGEAD
jgi:drug/metabolite transporter (DMT)-like permease